MSEITPRGPESLIRQIDARSRRRQTMFSGKLCDCQAAARRRTVILHVSRVIPRVAIRECANRRFYRVRQAPRRLRRLSLCSHYGLLNPTSDRP